MNLEFNIAIHVLAFLTKHNHQRYHSTALAELTCINPVQLRRVAALLPITIILSPFVEKWWLPG